MTNSAPSAAETLPSEQHKNQILGTAGDRAADTEDIYLALDTVLDTRLGTLAVMGSEHAVRALDSGRYHRRLIDEFDHIPKQVFRQAYNKRDLETLKQSLVTNMVFFLRRLIKDSLLEAVVQQRVERMCFTVNVWPYDFSDPGLVEMLIGCIRFHTYSTSSVRIVSIPDEELTPQFCRDNFQIMIMYDWVEWLDKHKAFFENDGMPGVTLVVPEIFKEAVPTQDDIDRLELNKHNPFRMTETICARMFRLKHMPISLFSLHEGITKDTAKTLVDRVSVTQADIEEYLNKHHPKATLVRENPLPEVDLSESYQLL